MAGIKDILDIAVNEKLDIKVAENLFPTWPTIVASLIALVILLLILTKLVYKPVKNMYEKRQEYVQNNIDSSKNQLLVAHQEREQASEELLLARNRAEAIIEEANKVAESIKMQSVIEAKDTASNIIDSAKISIEEQKNQFYAQSKKMIVDVALKAASKVMEKEVDQKTHQKLIKEFIEKS